MHELFRDEVIATSGWRTVRDSGQSPIDRRCELLLQGMTVSNGRSQILQSQFNLLSRTCEV